MIPVRSCCGQRHLGAECPDGLVMCALCFDRVPKDRLYLLPNGAREDVCVDCAANEEQADPEPTVEPGEDRHGG